MAAADNDGSACAREKTFEVVLRGGTPWGFDVTGGQDEGQPLQISNVVEEGKAWNSGLINGDVLIRINDIACLTACESQQLISSAFRTLTLKLWRSTNTPDRDRGSSRTASYRQKLEDVRERDIRQRLDTQDDSVVYNQSKSSQGFRMRPRTRRGESFNVKKPARHRGDQDVNKLDPYKDKDVRNSSSIGQIVTGQSYHSFREGKLAQAKSSPSLLNPTQEKSTKNYASSTISGAKSSPNIKNDVDSERVNSGQVPKQSEYYNNNYERYSLDGPVSPLNVSWNLGSGDFKRTYQRQQTLSQNMYETTDSYDNDGKTSRSNKNTRRSLPSYMLQKYQADYENISDFGTTPLRSEKISEIVDLDSDGDDIGVLDLSASQKAQQNDPIQSPQSPPIPPVRDPSSLRYIRVNQSHEKYPSWPVTKPNSETEQSQPINTRAQSWTDHTNTNTEFPGKQRMAYTPGLRPLPERSSPNSERRGEDGKLRIGSDPGLKSEFVYDKFGRVRQRNYENVDRNQIKKFYESKPGYPPPQLDSDGHNLGDEKYNVPSPPERDVPLRDELGMSEKFPSADKQAVRPTSFGNKMRDRGQNSTSPLQSPHDPKTGPVPAPRSVPEAKPRERIMVDSCTSPQHSPKNAQTPGRSQHGPSSQIKSSSKAYIIKQTPYYNTSTQTDRSPTNNLPNMQVTIPKAANSTTKSDFGSQTSPTGTHVDNFSERHAGISSVARESAATYSAQDKKSNYADIKNLPSKKESEISRGKSSRNYADYSALRSNNYGDINDFKTIHQRYASDDGQMAVDNKAQDSIPHYSEYAPNQAPILRKLSEEFYKGRMPGHYDKRHHSPQESVPRTEPVQPGMKEAESYSSVVIHASESAGPFGRDDFGSRSSLSDSRHDLSSMESASNRSSIAKSRRSLDPSLLSHGQRGRTIQDNRYNSSSAVNHSRTVSSPTDRSHGPRRPHRSSDSSTPSQPKSSPDSRSSGSTHYSSSDHSRMSSSGHDTRLDSDTVFVESKSPTATNPASVKSESKDANVNVNLGRKPSMKKAYGIYDETERVLRGAAATLKAVNESQSLRKAGEIYVPMTRLSRGSSDSKILDQIQEENDVFQDGEKPRSRSSSGREETRGGNTDKTKRELFGNELGGQRSGMRRSTSEQISGVNKKPAADQQHNFKDSSPDLARKEPSTNVRLKTGEMMKRNSESDLKKIQQQAVLNFMEIKTGKRTSSSGSQEGEGQITLNSTTSLKTHMSPTQSVQDLISKTSENLANRTQRTDSFRRSGSSASSRNSQDYMDMNKPKRETEWSRMRSQGVGSFSCDVDGKSNRSSMCSENPYEDIGVFLAPGVTSNDDFTPDKHLDETQSTTVTADMTMDKKMPVFGSMETNLVSSPTYQNLAAGRRRPPPPPPLLSPDDQPPALPPRNYKTQPRLNDLNAVKKSPVIQDAQIPEDGNMAIDNSKIDFKSLMTQWESSPREDRYAADLRKQARKFSEQQQQQQQQQQPNSTTMTIKHSKTKINFSTSFKCEPALAHQATPPNSSNQSFEDQIRVASPESEQPMATEEGNKENKAPSTPGKHSFEEEDTLKTPPRVERSMSDLPLPSPPVIYGESVEGDNSYLPPPPPEVLEDEEKESGDKFADNSYGDYKTKKSRAPGNYQRSVSAAAVVLENADDEHVFPEKTKLGQNAWNSESSLNGAVSQPKRPRDLPHDISGNIPAFKVESTLRNVVKGTTQPLVPSLHRFPGALPNTISLDSLSESALRRPVPNTHPGSSRYDATPPHVDSLKIIQDKDSGRNCGYGYDSPGHSQSHASDNKCSVTAWLNKNESIANSPINPGLQPRNIHENLNIQRSKTFNQVPAQTEAKNVISPVRNTSSQNEIKKRSTFNSPTPYGARPYQPTAYSPVQHPNRSSQNNINYRPSDGNKITSKANNVVDNGVSPGSGNTISHDILSKNNLGGNHGDRPTYQHKADLSRDSGVGSTMTINSSASSFRYSGDFSKDVNSYSGNFNVKTSPAVSDNKSPIQGKGGNLSEINSPVHSKGGNISEINSPAHAKGGNLSDKNSPLHAKGGNTSDKNSPVHVKGGNLSNNSSPVHTKGGNTIENKNVQAVVKTNSPSAVNPSFVVSSSSAKPQHSPLSSNSGLVSDITNDISPKTVQSSDSSLKKAKSSESVIPAGTISHGRQRSQEELECDKQAKELAKELLDEDKKLSDVLTQDSTPKRMKYMDGLFKEPVPQRKLSSDDSERKITKDKGSSNNCHSDPETDQSALPSLYFMSHPKAVVEMQIRNDEEINKDIHKDINSSGLVKQKEELMEKLHKKLEILRNEKIDLKQEIHENDELGGKVLELVTEHCVQKPELGKFKIFIEDREKIVRLMLNLSGQLARAENAVQSLPASTNPKTKQSTIDKREKLKEKREEAMQLNADIEKRFEPILGALEETLTDTEMEDVKYYVSMKSKLTIDLQELEDRIKLGEEQIQELKKSIPYSKTSVN